MLTWSYFAYNSKNMGQYGSDTLRCKKNSVQHFLYEVILASVTILQDIDNFFELIKSG